MNYVEFNNWICHTVVPNSYKNTCLVMDNASYHNVISPEDKVPKMSMKKDTIIAWLLKHGIDHHSAKTKSDLIELANASEVSKSVFH